MSLRHPSSRHVRPARHPSARPRDRRSAGAIFAEAKRKDRQGLEKAGNDETAGFAEVASERRSAVQTKLFVSFSFRFVSLVFADAPRFAASS
jgi:hypothetical protein